MPGAISAVNGISVSLDSKVAGSIGPAEPNNAVLASA